MVMSAFSSKFSIVILALALYILQLSSAITVDRCPSNPLAFCDFYFDGYRKSVPILTLPKAVRDTAFGPVLYHKSSSNSVAVSNASSVIVCQKITNRIRSQFYMSGNGARLYTRVFNQMKRSSFESKCIVMSINFAQIVVSGKNYNLNPSDKNEKVSPKSRRCVYFRTNPKPPATLDCRKRSPPPPPPKAVVTYKKCPTNPLDGCDFYFSGYKSSVPILKIPNAKRDTPFGPVLYHKSSTQTVAVSNASSNIICTKLTAQIRDQFYMSGNGARLVARVFNQLKRSYFESRCMVMKINFAQLIINGNNYNLQPKDKYDKISPKNKRCVYFKTAPNPPKTLSCK